MSPPSYPQEHGLKPVSAHSGLSNPIPIDGPAPIADASAIRLDGLMREFRGRAAQRGLPIPGQGQGPYDHRGDTDRGKTCRTLGNLCTSLGCMVAAGLAVATMNVGAFAVPVAIAATGLAYAATLGVAGALRLMLDAYPNNPDSLLSLRRIAGASGLLVGGSTSALLYLRFSDDPAVLAWLGGVLLILEGSLLLSGATLDTMARIYLWSHSALEEFDRFSADSESKARKKKYDDETRRKD